MTMDQKLRIVIGADDAGFEYKEAEMANCLEHYARAGDKVISNKNSYAQFNAIEWSNA